MMLRQHVGKGTLGLMVAGVILQSMEYFTHPYSTPLNIDLRDANVNIKTSGLDVMEDDDIVSDNIKGTTANEVPSTTGSPGSSDWWKGYVEQTSIVFMPSNSTDWCQGDLASDKRYLKTTPSNPPQTSVANERSMPSTGLYFVKTPKAGSSTAAGVALQIAEAIAEQKGLAESCPYHANHGVSYVRRKEPYFLWTIIREPAKRAISQYFFGNVSRRHNPYNSTQLIDDMHTKRRNFQLRYTGRQPGTARTRYRPMYATNPQVVEMVQDIMKTFHFIAITERMDESLVVMKLLYNFPDWSIVVLSSKQAGGFDGGRYQNQCSAIQPSYTTPDVDEYIAGKFRERNYDYFLYEVVNRSLDRTIDMLGRKFVEREVQRHKELKRLAEEKCYDVAIFPCTKDGVPPDARAEESCYFDDCGCGHECVHRVIRDHVMATRQ